MSDWIDRKIRWSMMGIVGGLLLTSVFGHAAPVPFAYHGWYSFNVMQVEKSLCLEVNDKLEQILQKLQCHPGKTNDTASGKVGVVICSSANQKVVYYLYKSAASCRNERETQLANGD